MAGDEPAARRIAEAVIRTVPASPKARTAKAAGMGFTLVVREDWNDPSKWIAYETLTQSLEQAPERVEGEWKAITVHFASHGLAFRIDRCTGAISDMHYSR